jgi:hypothetical protein
VKKGNDSKNLSFKTSNKGPRSLSIKISCRFSHRDNLKMLKLEKQNKEYEKDLKNNKIFQFNLSKSMKNDFFQINTAEKVRLRKKLESREYLKMDEVENDLRK